MIALVLVVAVSVGGFIWLRAPVVSSTGVVEFGEVAVGESATSSVSVSTTRAATLDTFKIDGPDTESFQVIACEDPSINVFQSCLATVTFSPRRPGVHEAELVVGAGPEFAYTWLTGLGIGPVDSPALKADPEAMEFEQASDLVERVVTITNQGGSVVAIGEVAITDDPDNAFVITGDDCSYSDLLRDFTCEIQIRYVGSGAAGDQATLSVPTEDGQPPLTIALSGGEPASSPSAGPSESPVASPSPLVTPSPQPTATPTRTPVVTPRPKITPPPPTPTPTPTPHPTPAPLTVGDYRCLLVEEAVNAIDADGFSSNVITPFAGPDWWVVDQAPDAGTQRPPGTTISLAAEEFQPGGCP